MICTKCVIISSHCTGAYFMDRPWCGTFPSQDNRSGVNVWWDCKCGLSSVAQLGVHLRLTCLPQSPDCGAACNRPRGPPCTQHLQLHCSAQLYSSHKMLPKTGNCADNSYWGVLSRIRYWISVNFRKRTKRDTGHYHYHASSDATPNVSRVL